MKAFTMLAVVSALVTLLAGCACGTEDLLIEVGWDGGSAPNTAPGFDYDGAAPLNLDDAGFAACPKVATTSCGAEFISDIPVRQVFDLTTGGTLEASATCGAGVVSQACLGPHPVKLQPHADIKPFGCGYLVCTAM